MFNETPQDHFEKGRLVDGIFRWYNNDKVAPNDILEGLYNTGFINFEQLFDSMKTREKEVRKTLTEYKDYRAKNGYSQEERLEMTAAFGKDAKLVDVLTGKGI